MTTVHRPLSLTGLVAELRRPSPTRTPADGPARRRRPTGWRRWPPPVPAAPTRTSWWGLAALSDDRPVRAADEPVRGQPVQGRVVPALRAALVARARRRRRHVRRRAERRHPRARGRRAALTPETQHRGGAAGPARRPAADRRPRHRLGGAQGAGEGRGHGAPARALARRQPPSRGRHRARVRRRGRPGPARRPGRPARARRRRPAGGRRPQDRHRQGAGRRAARARPARRLPGGGRGRRLRRGCSESGGAELVQVGKAGGARTSRSSTRRRWPATTTPAGPARWCSRWRRGWPARPSGRSTTATARICPVRTSCPVQDDGRPVTG